MEPDRDTLSAFVDGELPPEDMERIAALLETRPDLDRFVREQERLRAALRQRHPLPDAVPDRLAQAVRSAPVSWRWRLRAVLRTRGVLVPAIGTAAALALGVVLGVVLRPSSDVGVDAAGRLVAQDGLAHALTVRLASAGYPGSGPRLGISYRDRSGRDCRTFTSAGTAGFACREEGSWVIGMLVREKSESPGAAYRMAGSEMPDAIRRAVTAGIAGVPFDAAAEKAARDRGWR